MEIKDKIIIASDFSDHPGARYRKDGEFSGEQFLDEILRPRFEKAVSGGYLLLVDLDRVYGYPSSFVSGSFGKLSLDKGASHVLQYLRFKSIDNPLNEEKIVREVKDPTRKGL